MINAKGLSKIRQKLINESNLKRYLLYAIGEILLALQVNNRGLIGMANESENLKAAINTALAK